MELQAPNGGRSEPFIMKNEGVTKGPLRLAGKAVNFVSFTSNKSSEPSRLSYAIHYIPSFVALGRSPLSL